MVTTVTYANEFVYLHTDNIYTPRLATDAVGAVVWEWDYDSFGYTRADEDPDGNDTEVLSMLRMPGQYFDVESGFHYNWHRYYDPVTGRYLSSDPIGLIGGLNTYSYVDENLIKYVDIYGLIKCTCRARQTGNRGDDGVKVCTYYCDCTGDCGKKTTQKVIKVPESSFGSAVCRGQWEDLWQPGEKTGFEDFTIDTESIWDNLFNGKYVRALE